MFTLGNTLTYQLYRGICDMRKSFDGLCGLVRNELGRQAGQRGSLCLFEPSAHPDQTAALAAGRIRTVLQTPGERALYAARLEG